MPDGRHGGDNAVVKIDGSDLEWTVSYDLTEKDESVNLTALSDTAPRSKPRGKPGWSGSITFRQDHGQTVQPTLRAGTQFTIAFYEEGDVSGKTYFSGVGNILERSFGSPQSGQAIDGKISVEGDGSLTSATVA